MSGPVALYSINDLGVMKGKKMAEETIGRLFEGGQQIRKLLMEKVIDQGGMDRAALVFGMVELIVDLKPEDEPMTTWLTELGKLFGHFANQKEGRVTKQ